MRSGDQRWPAGEGRHHGRAAGRNFCNLKRGSNRKMREETDWGGGRGGARSGRASGQHEHFSSIIAFLDSSWSKGKHGHWECFLPNRRRHGLAQSSSNPCRCFCRIKRKGNDGRGDLVQPARRKQVTVRWQLLLSFLVFRGILLQKIAKWS